MRRLMNILSKVLDQDIADCMLVFQRKYKLVLVPEEISGPNY